MRKRLYQIIVTAGDGDKLSALYDGLMLFLIVLSLVPLAFKTETPALVALDRGCAFVFVLDYLLRWITADYKLPGRGAAAFLIYPFTPMAIIDLLSVLPSFRVITRGFKILRVLRMFRALRVLRVFKVARYSRNVKIILDVLRQSKNALLAVCALAGAYVLICALVILNVEPESFDNFFEAVYWATVSLTTMGYGDLYPVTSLGRIFTMISSIFGIAIIALPAGIITAGYMSAIEKRGKKPRQKRRVRLDTRRTTPRVRRRRARQQFGANKT